MADIAIVMMSEDGAEISTLFCKSENGWEIVFEGKRQFDCHIKRLVQNGISRAIYYYLFFFKERFASNSFLYLYKNGKVCSCIINEH